jgi:putative transposase
MSERKAMIKARQPLSVSRQCQLLVVPRSSVYSGLPKVSNLDIELTRQLNELYLKWPINESRRLCEELRQRGYPINRNRVRRLMRRMGLLAM